MFRLSVVGSVLLAAWGLAWCVAAPLSATNGFERITQDKEDDEAIEFFRKWVEPVLKEHCYECHSKDAVELKGELRLDTQEGLRRGGANGPAVVPGDIEASFLIRAMRYKEDDYKMPPRGKLDDDVIRVLETWIKKGARDGR